MHVDIIGSIYRKSPLTGDAMHIKNDIINGKNIFLTFHLAKNILIKGSSPSYRALAVSGFLMVPL
jgi:hypothetical protein